MCENLQILHSYLTEKARNSILTSVVWIAKHVTACRLYKCREEVNKKQNKDWMMICQSEDECMKKDSEWMNLFAPKL